MFAVGQVPLQAQEDRCEHPLKNYSDELEWRPHRVGKSVFGTGSRSVAAVAAYSDCNVVAVVAAVAEESRQVA